MKDAVSLRMAIEQDQRISDVVRREQSRLRDFIRRRVPDPRDAEDVLQDVFYKLVEANRLLMPIEHVTGWRGAQSGAAADSDVSADDYRPRRMASSFAICSEVSAFLMRMSSAR